MKHLFCFLFTFISFNVAFCQSYRDSILQYRQQYIKDLMAEKRLALKPTDIKYIHFFEPDLKYRVWGTFNETPGSKPFLVQTHSGKQKTFKEYGVFNFVIDQENLQLHVYQIIDLVNAKGNINELFIPFNDFTNYDITYGGGRYLDLTMNDIKEGYMLLDFNKSYNPYCAYAEGFSCPIPPDENRLHIEIRAGEKMYSKFLSEQ